MSDRLRYSLLFALLGALFFFPFLGGVHLFDWDEINFAEISREMVVTGDYLRVYVNYQPFWQKPPFFFWTQALAMHLFGIGEYASRFPNAVCGIITLVLLFHLGRRLYNTRFGIIWAGAYLGSVLPFLYFKSAIIDPYFNLFIFLGLYYFILFYWKKENMLGGSPAGGKKSGQHPSSSQAESTSDFRLPTSDFRLFINQALDFRLGPAWSYLFIAGLFIGMGILTKGPVAYLIAVLTMGVYWIYKRFRFYISVPQFLFFTVAASLITLTWFGIETWAHGPWFVKEFTRYQYKLFSTPDAGHKGFPGYHFVVLLVGCFPASIFALRSFFRFPAEEQAYQQDFRMWMKFLFWTVLILFSIVQSKIVHYSSMCYFPLTFLAALTIDKILRGVIPFPGWMKGMLLGIGGLFVLATVAMPFIGMNAEVLKPLFKDPFAQGNLEAAVHWTGWEILPGLFLLALLLLSIRWFNQGYAERGFRWLFGGTAVFVLLTLVFFVKRIEGYSQRAAIEFFESKAGEDAYFMTHAYKSYAHLFYSRKSPETNPLTNDREWLLHNPEVDKDVYIVTKVHKADELRALPGLQEIGGKNGFVFFVRRVE